MLSYFIQFCRPREGGDPFLACPSAILMNRSPPSRGRHYLYAEWVIATTTLSKQQLDKNALNS